MNKFRLIHASAYAAIVSIWFSVVITIWGDMHAPLKASLASMTGHHWVTKGWLSLGLYALVFALVYSVSREADRKASKALWMLVTNSILATVAMFGFFVWHYM